MKVKKRISSSLSIYHFFLTEHKFVLYIKQWKNNLRKAINFNSSLLWFIKRKINYLSSLINFFLLLLITVQRPVDIKNRPRIPIPDEDPYSVAGNGGGSSGSSGFGTNGVNGGNGQQQGHVAATREQLILQTQQLAQRRSEKPPKLPPRDNLYPHELPKVLKVRKFKTKWSSFN